MRWTHPDHPGRLVRLGYCTNVHPGETLQEVMAGLRGVSVPLRERLVPEGRLGVGLHLPAVVAGQLAGPSGAADLEQLGVFLAESGLDPFTYNAFPYGGFHADGLKEGVYRPTWAQPEREAYTLDVARVAQALAAARPAGDPLAQLSISTHPGSYGAWVRDRGDLLACAHGMARVLVGLVQLDGPPLVLSLEAEPFASASNSRALAEYLVVARTVAERALVEAGHSESQAARLAARRLGTCLDACHSAVEFEMPAQSYALAAAGGGLGKIQFSSALSLADPGANADGRAALLALDEPRYLHQVRGEGDAGLLGVEDLPQLSAALESGGGEWLECGEWRCHFHVPVDLEQVQGLGTTRAHADALLLAALEDPSAWPRGELHVEVETYTWAVLPESARAGGELLEGLERELRHASGVLRGAGWECA